ncbi:MAG: DRTGG domain-containing protein [Oscillospiraceae bacterium]|nr:DRTGG domain-containing protein [Oscillospiraceae bacterium]
MTVSKLKEQLNLETLAEGNDEKLKSCYISDLLSRVLGGCKPGDVWITVQTSKNMVAVAVMVEAGCVILPEGLTAPVDILETAKEEGLTIFTSEDTAYELAKKISALLL